MAYKGYKGCGPKKLGSSPLKQKFETTQYDKNIQNLSDSEKSSYKKGQNKAIKIAAKVASVIPAVRGVSMIAKGAKALSLGKIAGSLAKSPKTAKFANTLLKASKPNMTSTSTLPGLVQVGKQTAAVAAGSTAAVIAIKKSKKKKK
tara:strand:- start:552 stop:989 length:438 start_codon:yes stop_codon:yes gene_type:complete